MPQAFALPNSSPGAQARTSGLRRALVLRCLAFRRSPAFPQRSRHCAIRARASLAPDHSSVSKARSHLPANGRSICRRRRPAPRPATVGDQFVEPVLGNAVGPFSPRSNREYAQHGQRSARPPRHAHGRVRSQVGHPAIRRPVRERALWAISSRPRATGCSAVTCPSPNPLVAHREPR
jgi:hypothetical protein